ncbi:MAG: hypothetical protein AAGC46_13435 [Solirubrobacteraceae bacterium]|nr:hypothetical protein [Patulibacter sp.]
MTIASTTLAVAAPGIAQAAPSCADQPTTKAFAKYGDSASYSLAPAGNFETGALGWALTAAKIVRGNDAQDITDGSYSLSLGNGLLPGVAMAVSPAFCVTDEHPYFRYMYKANGLVGLLSTWLRYTDIDGTTKEVLVHSRTNTTLLPGFWRASDLQPLAVDIPMTQAGKAASVQLVFRSPVNVLGSSYQIDSVLIDPYRKA